MRRFLPLLLLACTLLGCNVRPRVVLYSAQDEEFADKVLPDFQQHTGIRVDTKFDTEKDKSVSLYAELVAERRRPRCDVFWNNEILSTIRLQRQGMLAPYDSPAARPFPAWCHGPDNTWHAFADRARILIVNTELVKEADRPRGLFDMTNPRWKGKIAMAKPQFGTSATQAACLFEVLGPDRARQFYRDLHANGVQIAPGNKQVAEWVGSGHKAGGIAFGITDIDDAMEEVEAGHPVAILFPDHDGSPDNPRLGTLFIPNTLAILNDCPNPEGARKLVDYLLSPEVEAGLAESASHQIPLNPQVHAKLPPQLEPARTARRMQVDYDRAADLWDDAQRFLVKEFGE